MLKKSQVSRFKALRKEIDRILTSLESIYLSEERRTVRWILKKIIADAEELSSSLKLLESEVSDSSKYHFCDRFEKAKKNFNILKILLWGVGLGYKIYEVIKNGIKP